MERTGVNKLGVHWVGEEAHIQVWAPHAHAVSCVLIQQQKVLALKKKEYGYWFTKSLLPQRDEYYKIIIDGEAYPDPASLSQPEGVHGPSSMIDLTFSWTDEEYIPPAQEELIIYELHVGTFSASRDFSGVIEKIPYLKELGVNAIELMPITQFPGQRNWGYDGVFPFAVQNSYGGARGLQRLVDACHEANMSVILDVVYNHFGPEGNYLPHFGPYLTDKYHTPWGQAVNYDDQLNHGVRDFIVANVRMWFEDFHIDGLRLDAVHAIKDFSPVHILQDIRRETDALISAIGKQKYLFAECDLNDKRFLEPLDINGFGMDAQWLDEFHHALRVTVGEQKKGYYNEFDGIAHLAKAYEKAYVYDGCYSTHRKKFFGSEATGIPGKRFIVFSQNHDQVGNRMLGERSASLYSEQMTKLMVLAVFLSPYIPLLFMGEEWGTKTPFQYFVSHSDHELIEMVREGREREFAEFQMAGAVPDPQDELTFERSTLDWNDLRNATHQQQLIYYKELIKLRRTHPVWKNIQRKNLKIDCRPKENILTIQIVKEHMKLLALLNFSNDTRYISIDTEEKWKLIWTTQTGTGATGIAGEGSATFEIAAQTGLVYATSER